MQRWRIADQVVEAEEEDVALTEKERNQEAPKGTRSRASCYGYLSNGAVETGRCVSRSAEPR